VDSALVPVAREALLVALLVSAPPLGAAFLAGLLSGTFQAATQVQDHSLGAVPRVAAVAVTLAVAAPWVASRVARFGAACIDAALRVPP
jgi:type III secretory pathway component EscS